MRNIVHSAVAALCAFLILMLDKNKEIDINVFYFIAVAVIGGLLPDIDILLSGWMRKSKQVSVSMYGIIRHRNFFHSFFFVAVAGYITAIFEVYFGLALTVGMLSHILFDVFSPPGVGVALLFPFKAKRYMIIKRKESITKQDTSKKIFVFNNKKRLH